MAEESRKRSIGIILAVHLPIKLDYYRYEPWREPFTISAREAHKFCIEYSTK